MIHGTFLKIALFLSLTSVYCFGMNKNTGPNPNLASLVKCLTWYNLKVMQQHNYLKIRNLLLQALQREDTNLNIESDFDSLEEVFTKFGRFAL